MANREPRIEYIANHYLNESYQYELPSQESVTRVRNKALNDYSDIKQVALVYIVFFVVCGIIYLTML